MFDSTIHQIIYWLALLFILAMGCVLAAVVVIIAAGFINPAGGHVDMADLNPMSLVGHGWVGVGGLVALTVACLVLIFRPLRNSPGSAGAFCREKP